MAHIGLQFTKTENFKNYITLIIALKLVEDGLLQFMFKCLDDIHKKLSSKCAGCIPCDENCSKRNVQPWCPTCQKWKTELSIFMRYESHKRTIKWEKFDSSLWGRDSKKETINQIAYIFIHNCRDPAEPFENDFLNIISIMENCIYFHIGNDHRTINSIRKVRNAYFAHNATYELEEKDLQWCLNKCLLFLNHSNLQSSDCCKHSIAILTDLKSRNNRPVYVKYEYAVHGLIGLLIDAKNTWKVKEIVLQNIPNILKKEDAFNKKELVISIGLPVLTCLSISLLYMYMYPNSIQSQIPENDKNTEGWTDVHIYSRTNWSALTPNGTSPFSKPARYFFVHHTVTNTCHTFESCVSIVQEVQRFHMFNRGWDDIGYSFLVGQDGSIFEGRGWDKVGAHTRGFNNVGYAAGFIGNFQTDFPSAASLHAAKMLIEYGVGQGYISREYTLLGHRDVRPTLSPGENLYERIKSWPHYGQLKM